jgi:hypothetical protein
MLRFEAEATCNNMLRVRPLLGRADLALIHALGFLGMKRPCNTPSQA